ELDALARVDARRVAQPLTRAGLLEQPHLDRGARALRALGAPARQRQQQKKGTGCFIAQQPVRTQDSASPNKAACPLFFCAHREASASSPSACSKRRRAMRWSMRAATAFMRAWVRFVSESVSSVLVERSFVNSSLRTRYASSAAASARFVVSAATSACFTPSDAWVTSLRSASRNASSSSSSACRRACAASLANAEVASSLGLYETVTPTSHVPSNWSLAGK